MCCLLVGVCCVLALLFAVGRWCVLLVIVCCCVLSDVVCCVVFAICFLLFGC